MAGLVEHILGGGGAGLFVLGGCGEGAWLTPEQRSGVVRAAVAAAGSRAPVLAGVMLPATGPAAEAARRAAGDGADAIVAGSPYYVQVDAGAQRRHVEALLAATDLPVLLYNIPPATHHVLTPETVAALAVDPRVLGIKDSAGDLAAFAGFLEVKARRPDFRVLQGSERVMTDSLLLGGDGLVPGLGNVAPALFVALLDAVRQGDEPAARRLQAQIDDLGTLHAAGHWLPALKSACARIGFGNGRPAPPLEALDAAGAACVAAIVGRAAVLR
jgi:4-hydroxy-tetrahydrodipicolinate synthase